MKRHISCKRRGLQSLLLAVVVAASAAVLVGLGAGAALAAVQVSIDQQGANDEPGQKDLTRFTFDDASPAGTLIVTFNHDETGFPGNNTGDGCFLFDTNGDGNANAALCVTFGGNPSTWQSTRLFTCGDSSSFRCTNPQTEIASFSSTCGVAVTNTDPFPAGADSPDDTTTSCTIVLADIQPGSPVLIDVCSYPSAQPNSDPSDCVLQSTNPGAVTLQSFTATGTSAGVVLRWRTGSEVGTLGFNVYRVKAGKLVKLNRAVIASKAKTLGGSYRFVDRTAARPGTRYRLQEVTLRGTRSWIATANLVGSG